MLHISVASDDPKELGAKYLVSPQFSLAVPDIVPINTVNLVGSHLITPVIPINELGKQLLKAAAEGNVEELKTLMSKGAPFTADWLGTTPLHLAAQNNHLEICRILLRAGISRDAKTKVDRTPLHMAAAEGNLEIVETLLLHGAICNCRDMLAMTPLHWAAQNGHADIVVVLLKYGAAADVVNKFNLTPADIAKQIDRLDIVDLLLAPSDTSEHLSVQLSNDEDSMDLAVHNDIGASAVETVLLEDYSEDEDSPQPVPVNNKCDTLSNETLNDDLQVDDNSESFSESLKLLQQHGITMLPNEDNNILSSIMESGHSVVLTDIGKEVLNSVKLAEPKLPAPVEPKAVQKLQQNRIITLTPEQFLEITSNGMLKPNWVKALNGKTSHSINKPVKTVVMKKNKTTPVFKTSKSTTNQDLETVMKQLIEARKVIQEYKLKLSKKEAEAERYKQQLKIILGRQ